MKQYFLFCEILQHLRVYSFWREARASFSILSRYSVTSLSMVLRSIILTATLSCWFRRSQPSQTMPVDPLPRTFQTLTRYSLERLIWVLFYMEIFKFIKQKIDKQIMQVINFNFNASKNQHQFQIYFGIIISVITQEQINMCERFSNIIDLLSNLLTNPKQATIKIDSEYHTNSNFLHELTSLIIGDYEKSEEVVLGQSVLKLGLTTFNSLVSRFLIAQKSISDYFTVDEMFVLCKKILFCNSFMIVDHKNNTKVMKKRLFLKEKILVIKSLTLFLENSSLNFSEIQNMVKEANKFDALDSLLLILQAVLNSSMQKIIKIKSIGILFEPILNAIVENIKIALNFYQEQILYQIKDSNKKGLVYYSECFYVTEYWIRLVYQCLKLFRQMQLQMEFEVFEKIITQNTFLQILGDIVAWCLPTNTAFPKIIWHSDLFECGLSDSKLRLLPWSKINKLKSMAFSTIQIILAKTSKEYNLMQTDNPLMKRVPDLCGWVFHEIEEQVVSLLKNEQNPYSKSVIGELDLQMISKMFGFLAESVYFLDCHQFFTQEVLKRKTVELLMIFLVPLQLQIDQFQNQPDRFADYLDSLVSENAQANYSMLPRCAVSKFINVCCLKIDGFTSFWFEACYKTLIFHFGKVSESDRYQNLSIIESQFDDNPIGYMNGETLIGGETCLLGILTISGPTLKQRPDLQQTYKQLIRVINLKNLNNLQLSIFYEILIANCSWIKQSEQTIEKELNSGRDSLLLQYSRIISYVYSQMDEEDSSCFIVGLNFINRIYNYVMDELFEEQSERQADGRTVHKSKQTVRSEEDFHNIEDEEEQEVNYLQKIYETIICEYIWPPLSQKIKSTKSFYYFQNLTEISYYFQNRKDYHDPIRAYDHQFMRNLMQSMKESLIYCYQKLSWLYRSPNHDETLCYKIHHSIKSLLGQIFEIGNVIGQSKNNEQMGLITEHFIEQCLNPHKLQGEREYVEQCTLDDQQQSSFVEIAGILIQNNVFICSETSRLLMNVLLKRPFCNQWQLSLGYCIAQIKDNFDLNQNYRLISMIQDILQVQLGFYEMSQPQKKIVYKDYQNKINQLNLVIDLYLQYNQPESWDTIHQLIRIHLLKSATFFFQKNVHNQGKSIIITPQKWKPLSLTVMRLFHIYLKGFKLETNQKLLLEILDQFQLLIDKYSVADAYNLLKGFHQSLNYMQPQIIRNFIRISLKILNKLIINCKHFGNEAQSKWQIQTRESLPKFIQKTSQRTLDPFIEFNKIMETINQMRGHHYFDLQLNEEQIKIITKVSQMQIIKGQPRKFISLRKNRGTLN